MIQVSMFEFHLTKADTVEFSAEQAFIRHKDIRHKDIIKYNGTLICTVLHIRVGRSDIIN